jgi:hypothetical protein
MKPTELRQTFRPLLNAHWSLVVLIVACYIFFFESTSCETGQKFQSIFSLLVAFTISIVFWVNHLRFYPIEEARKLLLYMACSVKDLILLSLFVFIAEITMLNFTGTVDCYTDRSKISEAILSTSEAKALIEENIKSSKKIENIGNGVPIPAANYINFSRVLTDGTIIIAGSNPNFIAIQEPKIHENIVEWKCIGFSQKKMPSFCREN